MLFIHNPLPLPSERGHKVEIDDRQHDCNKQCDLVRVIITGVFFYVLASLFSIILNYPISLIAIIIPTIVLVYTIVILSGDGRRILWPCIFVTFAGFVLKLLAIILFFIIYPLREDENNPKRIPSRMRPGLFGWTKLDEKGIFFGAFFVAEFILLILTCCIHCHLVAFCDRPPTTRTRTTRRNTKRGHPV